MDSSERSVRIDLGYHGAGFHGSQRQTGVRTVQGELEDALHRVTGTETRLVFAGRTDRGVHALGQVASGTVVWLKELERLRYALDSLTNDDLVVREVSEVDASFHARFSASRREYRYRIWISQRAPVLSFGLAWWIRGDLDLSSLNRASEQLVGTHDFRAFTGKGFGSGESERNTERVVDLCDWHELTSDFEPGGRLIEFRIGANSYLPHMVRNLVGALVEIGAGRQNLDLLRLLVRTRDRRHAPPPAPPHGLVLWRVDYDSNDQSREPGRTARPEQE